MGILSEAISGFLGVAVQGYYARQGALGEMKKRELCSDLTALRKVLLQISENGDSIGTLVNSSTFYKGLNDNALGDLITLLEVQKSNLENAQGLFEKVAKCLEIDAPQLARLEVHIRGKEDRIEVIYNLAGRTTLPPWVNGSLKSWERSKLLANPRKLIGSLTYRPRPDFRDDKPSEYDEDFEAIVQMIEPFTDFIKEICPAQYRI